jgi:hypothetical protein
MRLSASELEQELIVLLGMVHRLSLLNQRPELFFEQKDALAHQVAGLMMRCGLGRQARRSPAAFRSPQSDQGASRLAIGGRTIAVERRGGKRPKRAQDYFR